MKFVVLLSFLFLSCSKMSSDEVDQSKIFTSYALTYNAEMDEVYAKATFFVDKMSKAFTYLELTKGSEVSLNGQKLEVQEGLGKGLSFEYSTTLKARNLDQAFVFRYINNDDKVFENTFYLIESPSLKELIPTIELDGFSTLTLEKDSLPERGNLYFNLRDQNERSLKSLPIPFEQVSSEGEASFKMDNQGFRRPFTRKGEIEICSGQENKNIKAPKAGGLLMNTSCSQSYGVLILN